MPKEKKFFFLSFVSLVLLWLPFLPFTLSRSLARSLSLSRHGFALALPFSVSLDLSSSAKGSNRGGLPAPSFGTRVSLSLVSFFFLLFKPFVFGVLLHNIVFFLFSFSTNKAYRRDARSSFPQRFPLDSSPWVAARLPSPWCSRSAGEFFWAREREGGRERSEEAREGDWAQTASAENE